MAHSETVAYMQVFQSYAPRCQPVTLSRAHTLGLSLAIRCGLGYIDTGATEKPSDQCCRFFDDALGARCSTWSPEPLT